MREAVANSLSKSTDAFTRIVWPEFSGRFGYEVPIESVTESGFAKELDVRAGIDEWIIGKDSHMRGLASRVQFGPKAWNTFTVRMARPSGAPTEYEKRCAQIALPGTIWPHYTLQAYVYQDKLLAAALCLTRDLMQAVTDGVGWTQKNRQEGAPVLFHVVPWDHWHQNGLHIKIVSADQLAAGTA